MCRDCGDLFNLSLREKVCSCGATKGKYTDHINAVYSSKGTAVPLCFANGSVVRAMTKQRLVDITDPDQFKGERFDAWICPKSSNTFKEEVTKDGSEGSIITGKSKSSKEVEDKSTAGTESSSVVEKIKKK